MWYTVNELAPEDMKEHVIWAKAEHSGYEFPCICYYHDKNWFFNGRNVELNGWDVMAWYDLPPYKS